jgi:hypothetical protein
MKMHHDTRVHANAFQRLSIVDGVTSDACEEVVNVCARSDFGGARYRLDMTQSDTLRRREMRTVGIV